MDLRSQIIPEGVPQHIAVIMDGNNRAANVYWAILLVLTPCVQPSQELKTLV
jgi:undecaprenyl pyrophosphate synthase